MTGCYRHYPIVCKCPTCVGVSSADARNTHNQHLRHSICRLEDGHQGVHEFEVEGTIITEPTDRVFLGQLMHRDSDRRCITVQANKGYGITIPSEVTTNGSIWEAARCIVHRLSIGYTWTGPSFGGTTLEHVVRALRCAYYEAFPEEYARETKWKNWDVRGPAFQWPEVNSEVEVQG